MGECRLPDSRWLPLVTSKPPQATPSHPKPGGFFCYSVITLAVTHFVLSTVHTNLATFSESANTNLATFSESALIRCRIHLYNFSESANTNLATFSESANLCFVKNDEKISFSESANLGSIPRANLPKMC
jgi:hypothetical protein